jgi:hypothetical protein
LCSTSSQNNYITCYQKRSWRCCYHSCNGTVGWLAIAATHSGGQLRLASLKREMTHFVFLATMSPPIAGKFENLIHNYLTNPKCKRFVNGRLVFIIYYSNLPSCLHSWYSFGQIVNFNSYFQQTTTNFVWRHNYKQRILNSSGEISLIPESEGILDNSDPRHFGPSALASGISTQTDGVEN